MTGRAGETAQRAPARHGAFHGAFHGDVHDEVLRERERRIHHFLLGLVGIVVGTWLMVVAWVFAVIASEQSVGQAIGRLLG